MLLIATGNKAVRSHYSGLRILELLKLNYYPKLKYKI